MKFGLGDLERGKSRYTTKYEREGEMESSRRTLAPSNTECIREGLGWPVGALSSAPYALTKP